MSRSLSSLIWTVEPGADDLEAPLVADGVDVVGIHHGAESPNGHYGDAPQVIVLMQDGATRRAATIRALRAQLPETRIVVVAPSGRGHEVRSALEAGASGLVFRDEVDQTLAVAVRAAAAGQVCVPHSERRQVRRPTLSQREKQILGLVVMGYMNCEIATHLYLAESTVKSHLSSAFSKLGVRSRNEAVDLILDGKDGLGRGILAITGETRPPQAA